jgi:hypothetical protein
MDADFTQPTANGDSTTIGVKLQEMASTNRLN